MSESVEVRKSALPASTGCRAPVHPTGNVLGPLLISDATDVPFIIVIFGVIDGVAATGLVGVFVGPVILAIGLAVWRQGLVGEI